MEILNNKLLAEIVKVIIGYKKPGKIVIFGSRAENNFKNTSDIDIAIFGRDWIDRDVNIVKNMLDEYIKTPLKFDLLNFYAIAKDGLRKNILNEGKVIYESGKD